MYFYVCIIFCAISCNADYVTFFNYYYPTREQFHSLSSPEGRTWREWNKECKREYPGYGLLQRQYKEVTPNSAGQCAGEMVPLGMRVGPLKDVSWFEGLDFSEKVIVFNAIYDAEQSELAPYSDSDIPLQNLLLQMFPRKVMRELADYDDYNSTYRNGPDFEYYNHNDFVQIADSDDREDYGTKINILDQIRNENDTFYYEDEMLKSKMYKEDKSVTHEKDEEIYYYTELKNNNNKSEDFVDNVLDDVYYEDDQVIMMELSLPEEAIVGAYNLSAGKVGLVAKELRFKCAICQLLPRKEVTAGYPGPYKVDGSYVLSEQEEVCSEEVTGDDIKWPVAPEGAVIVKRNHITKELAVRHCARVYNTSASHISGVSWSKSTFWKEDLDQFKVISTEVLKIYTEEQPIPEILLKDANRLIQRCSRNLLRLTLGQLNDKELHNATHPIEELIAINRRIPVESRQVVLSANTLQDIESITKYIVFSPKQYMIVSPKDYEFVGILVADLSVAMPVLGAIVHNYAGDVENAFGLRRNRLAAIRYAGHVEPYMAMLMIVHFSRSQITANSRVSFIHFPKGIPFIARQSPQQNINTDFCMVKVNFYGSEDVTTDSYLDINCVPQGSTKYLVKNDELLKFVSFTCSRWSTDADDWLTDGCSVTVEGSFEYERYFSCRCQTVIRHNESATGGLFMVHYASDYDSYLDSFNVNETVGQPTVLVDHPIDVVGHPTVVDHPTGLNLAVLIGSCLSVIVLIVICVSALAFEILSK